MLICGICAGVHTTTRKTVSARLPTLSRTLTIGDTGMWNGILGLSCGPSDAEEGTAVSMRVDSAVGAMLGHGLGDALGAPVEFMSRREILETFGLDGLTKPEPWTADGLALARGSYTDDTQMMIATGRACLDAAAAWRSSGILDVGGAAHERYLAWLQTQGDPEQRRRPGATCLNALQSGEVGCVDDPINDRKGSGGI